MAKKKTQTAGKKPAASTTKKKATASKAGKNTKAAAKSPKVKTEYDNRIPVSTVMAIVSFILFVLFLVICIKLLAISFFGKISKMVVDDSLHLIGRIY